MTDCIARRRVCYLLSRREVSFLLVSIHLYVSDLPVWSRVHPPVTHPLLPRVATRAGDRQVCG